MAEKAGPVFKSLVQTQQMIKVGDGKFDPPKPRIDLWPKRVSKTQNQSKLDLAQIFRVVQAQQMIKVGDEKFDPLKPKIDFWTKSGSKNPKPAQNSTKSD